VVATAGIASGLVTSPVVRRILADGLVDPRSVTGSGPNGAITRRDAERAVAQGPSQEIRIPFTAGVKRMAEHMVQTVRTSPVGFVAAELDASILSDAPAVTSDGVSLQPELIVAVAAIRALADFDTLNAEVTGEELIVRRNVNVGIMKSLHPDGMLVPVIHAAGGLSVKTFARCVADLDERVASRQLTTDDLLGGTVSVLLAPSHSTTYAVPLLIQPQVAAVSIGAVRDVPVVRDGAIVIGRVVTVGVSFDHRVIEPVRAAQYVDRIGQILAGLNLSTEC
jgi:pyruvate dehydrogenase E2 component (dihydrolipoamide acetyltransferase)